MALTIKVDNENNAEIFWAALDAAYPEIADQLRAGETMVDDETWQAIQKLDGFSDGPSYARTALVVA